MKATTPIIIAAIAGMVLASCKKDTPHIPEPPAPPSVYVTGFDGNKAVLWKNDTAQYLTDGSNVAVAYTSYVTDNGDVYVSGYDGAKAVIWKNGTAQYLTDGTNSAQAVSVFVSGNDVYAGGFERNSDSKRVAKVWKNGTATILSDGKYNATIDLIYVSGSDVYAAGYEYAASGIRSAKVWKNGTAQSNLVDISGVTGNSEATAVLVSGGDVYVTGDVSDGSTQAPKLWKNGVEQPLSDIVPNAPGITQPLSVAVSGSDVYVAGIEYNEDWWDVAILWKNGVAQNLGQGYDFSDATSVAVSGSDVYVSGISADLETGLSSAIVWKNGIAHELPSTSQDLNNPIGFNTYAYWIFVK